MVDAWPALPEAMMDHGPENAPVAAQGLDDVDGKPLEADGTTQPDGHAQGLDAGTLPADVLDLARRLAALPAEARRALVTILRGDRQEG